MLRVHLGQLICCAAMIDDVASLILLAMISSISNDEDNDQGASSLAVADNVDDTDGPVWGPEDGVWSVVIPLITSLGFMAFSGILAYLTPIVLGLIPGVSRLAPDAWLAIFSCWATGLTVSAYYCRTTFLLGCFMAGVTFASEPRVVEAFDTAAPALSAWTSRVFFCSIGVPVSLSCTHRTHCF